MIASADVASDKPRVPLLNPSAVGRREILEGLFAGVGATVVFPAAHPHVTATEIAAAEARARAPGWKPAFLDPHQFATLTALCARIVPGSETAQADRFIDSLLAVDSREHQARFLSALGVVEGAAIGRFQRPFKALSEAQQVELLTALAGGEPARQDWIWKPGELLSQPDQDDETLAPRDHFDYLKAWIVDAYYSSEAGLKELGYTGQMFFAAFPNCEHEDHG
jgi:Gluconate 2-dehydrogenase subunit 3